MKDFKQQGLLTNSVKGTTQIMKNHNPQQKHQATECEYVLSPLLLPSQLKPCPNNRSLASQWPELPAKTFLKENTVLNNIWDSILNILSDT